MTDIVLTGQFVFLYFGDDANVGEDRANDLIKRGATIRSVSLAYGPPPARVAGLPHAPENSWHALIAGEWAEQHG
jgi:hypothetical protein